MTPQTCQRTIRGAWLRSPKKGRMPDLEGDSGATEQNEIHDVTLNRDVAIKEYLATSLSFRKRRTTVVPISADHAEQFA